jgi:NurA-like 5'-3' nuclease
VLTLAVAVVFNELILDAIKNREAKLARLKDANHNHIIAEAKSRWVAYDAKPQVCMSAGVDSSWNKRALQGFDLYAIAAVAVTSTNEIIAKEWDNDIGGSIRAEQLESRAMEMESLVAQKAHASGMVKIVCVDGSLISRLLKSTPSVAVETVRKYGDAIFISKTSESRSQFGALGSRAGDIYYYRQATMQAGFSVPAQVQSRGGSVYEIYMRLRDGMPVLRVELIKGSSSSFASASEQEIRNMMDLLRYHSVSGYPYCLKLAHKNCKISNDDIDRLASIYGLQNEPGARDALNE